MALSEVQILNRSHWVQKIHELNGDFTACVNIIDIELRSELDDLGLEALIGHLEFCGVIPEVFGHDSTQEKLYSKYTDILIALAFEQLGIISSVLTERSGAADVECVTKDYGFVADAKAFRLSRTAKNQKDFKIAALHTWKYGKPFALLVCPLYQLPSRTSQIYQQASERNVCIFSYAHLIVLLKLHEIIGESKTLELLHRIFLAVANMNPSQDAISYWKIINSEMFGFSKKTQTIWLLEKENAGLALTLLKQEALTHLAQERERIMRMSRAAAITELLKSNQLDSRIRVVAKVSSNTLFEVQL